MKTSDFVIDTTIFTGNPNTAVWLETTPLLTSRFSHNTVSGNGTGIRCEASSVRVGQSLGRG